MIPKLIHRVWLGPNTPHPDDVAATRLWADMYPDHRIVEWTDSTIHQLPLILTDEYAAAPTWVHRADIVSVEAVYHLGGILVGWDMEPIRNILHLVDGLEGWCTLDADGYPGGAFFGAVAGHQGLACLIEVIRARVADGYTKPNRDTGPYAWNDAFGPDGRMPDALTVVAGSKAAYPIHWKQKELLQDPEVVAGLRADPDVYAIHHFRGSWLKSGAKV